MKKTLATAIAVATLLAPAAAVHADTTDSVYLKVLREEGITGSDATLIRMGHAVCDLREAGWSEYRIAREIAERNDDMTIGDGGFVVGAAESAYCPQHA